MISINQHEQRPFSMIINELVSERKSRNQVLLDFQGTFVFKMSQFIYLGVNKLTHLK